MWEFSGAQTTLQIVIALEEWQSGELKPFNNPFDLFAHAADRVKEVKQLVSTFKTKLKDPWHDFCRRVHRYATVGWQDHSLQIPNLRYISTEFTSNVVVSGMDKEANWADGDTKEDEY
jgi:hypothetical protein